jgi:hypothetical protein
MKAIGGHYLLMDDENSTGADGLLDWRTKKYPENCRTHRARSDLNHRSYDHNSTEEVNDTPVLIRPFQRESRTSSEERK